MNAICKAARWLRCVLLHFVEGSAQRAVQISPHHWEWTCCACGRSWLEQDN